MILRASCNECIRTNAAQRTPPYFTTTVFPFSELAASAIVSATSEKFSGAAEINVLEMIGFLCCVVNGVVNADATENKVAVTVKTANDFIVVVV